MNKKNKVNNISNYYTLRYLISLGSLLHDIGKLIQRTGEESGNHEKIRKSFFKREPFSNLFNNISFKREKINYSVKDFIDAAFYHHRPSELSDENFKSIAKIYQKADHLSASERSGKKISKPNKKRLISIFQNINISSDNTNNEEDKKDNYFYPLKSLEIIENTSLENLEKIIFPY